MTNERKQETNKEHKGFTWKHENHENYKHALADE